jgi:hypothetical protein
MQSTKMEWWNTIQTIEDRTTVLLIQAGLGTKYWGEAIQCAVATWKVPVDMLMLIIRSSGT